jgi:cytochrome c biogenesis protein CcdA
MIDAPLALGFAAGMVAAFNPCGFALVPAYLTFFLGEEDADEEASAPVARAFGVGAAVSVGFVVVFGVAGILATTFSLSVERFAPWVSIPIGLALIAIGIATILGWRSPATLPRLAVGGTTRGLASMGLFGASYATVSLSCTLPVFLAVVATTFSDTSVLSGMAVFLAYALGMGTILTGLAVALAVARRPLAAGFRRAVPVVTRLGGVLLVVAGAYVSWYAVYEIRLEGDDDAAAGPVAMVTRWSGQVSNWVDEVGPERIAAGVLGLFLVAMVAGRLRGRRVGGRDRG